MSEGKYKPCDPANHPGGDLGKRCVSGDVCLLCNPPEDEQETKIGDGYTVKAIKPDLNEMHDAAMKDIEDITRIKSVPLGTRPSATHTYAELEVSRDAYDEIKGKLEEAGYGHAFMEDGAIDMHGIGLIRQPLPESVDIFINGKATSIPRGDGYLTYEEIRDIAYPQEYPENHNPSCTWSTKRPAKLGDQSGILSRGQRIPLEPGLRISMVDTGNA